MIFKNPIQLKNPGIYLRFVLLGSTLFSNKIILIVIAYFFSEYQYNLFNKAYYTASILILFGTLGFDLAVNRIFVSMKTVSLAVLLNIILTATVLYFISQPFTSFFQLSSIFIYSIFASLGGIYTFKHLFQGRIKHYVFMMLINSFLHLIMIPFITIFEVDIFLLFPLITVTWFLIGFREFAKYSDKTGSQFTDLYKIGFSTFIINSLVSLALIADKYLVNHNFPLETANAYTFSWGLIVPILYIGNLVEKLIYSSSSGAKKVLFNKAAMLLATLVLTYSAILLITVNLFPGLLPKSVNSVMLKHILNFMIWGYAIFSVVNFPINGYLFKFAELSKQKKIAVLYVATSFVFLIGFMLINGGMLINNYKVILYAIWVFIFILLTIKVAVVYSPSKTPGSNV